MASAPLPPLCIGVNIASFSSPRISLYVTTLEITSLNGLGRSFLQHGYNIPGRPLVPGAEFEFRSLIAASVSYSVTSLISRHIFAAEF